MHTKLKYASKIIINVTNKFIIKKKTKQNKQKVMMDGVFDGMTVKKLLKLGYLKQ